VAGLANWTTTVLSSGAETPTFASGIDIGIRVGPSCRRSHGRAEAIRAFDLAQDVGIRAAVRGSIVRLMP
jgi:hypothetical protein